MNIAPMEFEFARLPPVEITDDFFLNSAIDYMLIEAERPACSRTMFPRERTESSEGKFACTRNN